MVITAHFIVGGGSYIALQGISSYLTIFAH